MASAKNTPDWEEAVDYLDHQLNSDKEYNAALNGIFDCCKTCDDYGHCNHVGICSNHEDYILWTINVTLHKNAGEMLKLIRQAYLKGLSDASDKK